MRYKSRFIIAIVAVVIVTFTNIIPINALNTGFSVDDLSAEDIERIQGNIEITFLSQEPTKSSIHRFNVNEQGMIALVYKSGINKEVCKVL